jgi:hypothetical protein
MPKMMGFELSLKKIARSAKLQECSGMIPTTFTSSIARRLKEMASRCIACSRVPSYSYRASLVVAGTKFEALSN